MKDSKEDRGALREDWQGTEGGTGEKERRIARDIYGKI
jgi:hypothetical protein